jgi:hypothetical protein
MVTHYTRIDNTVECDVKYSSYEAARLTAVHVCKSGDKLYECKDMQLLSSTVIYRSHA